MKRFYERYYTYNPKLRQLVATLDCKCNVLLLSEIGDGREVCFVDIAWLAEEKADSGAECMNIIHFIAVIVLLFSVVDDNAIGI